MELNGENPMTLLPKPLDPLSSFWNSPSPGLNPAPVDSSNTVLWPVAKLKPNPLNPRGDISDDDETIQELADSIKESGLLQPPTITPDGLILCGHRRVKACRLAGLQEIPVFVRDIPASEQIVVMLTENIQRQDLNVVQEARAMRRLRQTGLDEAMIAERLGLVVVSVKRRLQILELPIDLQDLCAAGKLKLGHVEALIMLPPEKRLGLGLQAAEGEWPVHKLVKAVKEARKETGRSSGPTPQSELYKKRAKFSAIAGELGRIKEECERFHGLRGAVVHIEQAVSLIHVEAGKLRGEE